MNTFPLEARVWSVLHHKDYVSRRKVLKAVTLTCEHKPGTRLHTWWDGDSKLVWHYIFTAIQVADDTVELVQSTATIQHILQFNQ